MRPNKQMYKCKHCQQPSIPPDLAMQIRANVCADCGTLYPATQYFIENYFRIIQVSSELREAVDLLLKSETTSAVRESLIKLETLVKQRSGFQNLMGIDLMAKAFSFELDSSKQKVSVKPKIALNKMATVSQRNEQEGMKFVAMGLMQGIRNVYLHTEGSRKLFYSLQIINMVDFVIKHITGAESIATEAAAKSKRHNKKAERTRRKPVSKVQTKEQTND